MKLHSFLALVRHLALGGCSKFLVVKAVAGGCKQWRSHKFSRKGGARVSS